jgi:hypothetical protein
LENKIGSLINIEGAKSEKLLANAVICIFPSNIDNIYQYRPFQIVCPRKTLPLPLRVLSICTFHLCPEMHAVTKMAD